MAKIRCYSFKERTSYDQTAKEIVFKSVEEFKKYKELCNLKVDSLEEATPEILRLFPNSTDYYEDNEWAWEIANGFGFLMLEYDLWNNIDEEYYYIDLELGKEVIGGNLAITWDGEDYSIFEKIRFE